MRTHGTLIRWNDDRGFGFIVPAQGTDEIFVHISSFPRDSVRPRIHELVSFEIETDKDGRKRAVRVQRPGHENARRHAASRQAAPRRRNRVSALFPLLFVAAMGAYFYPEFRQRQMVLPAEPQPSSELRVANPEPVLPSHSYTCDGRTRCAQMGSCEEARFFNRHCPGATMDGDGDGNPCEEQWCGH